MLRSGSRMRFPWSHRASYLPAPCRSARSPAEVPLGAPAGGVPSGGVPFGAMPAGGAPAGWVSFTIALPPAAGAEAETSAALPTRQTTQPSAPATRSGAGASRPAWSGVIFGSSDSLAGGGQCNIYFTFCNVDIYLLASNRASDRGADAEMGVGTARVSRGRDRPLHHACQLRIRISGSWLFMTDRPHNYGTVKTA